MKRIKSACLLQTVCFQSSDPYPSEFNKRQIRQEYETYKTSMLRRGTKFKILKETVCPDGSIIVELKKQNNQQPIGEYFD